MILLWYNFCFTDTQTCAVVDSRSFNSPIIPDMCGSGQVSLRIKNRRAFDRRFTAFPCVPTGFKKNINCHVHTPYVFRSNTCTAPPVGLLPVSERFALLHNPPPPPSPPHANILSLHSPLPLELLLRLHSLTSAKKT